MLLASSTTYRLEATMLSKTMEAALNKQVHAEFMSFYVYRQMQAYFVQKNLDGFAHWMDLQSQEEHTHAMKLFDYIHDRRGKVHLAALSAPPQEWASPLAAAEAALHHEQMISRLIGELVDLAQKEGDHTTHTFLNWFVTEQVEEEATVDRICERMKLAGDSATALFMIDAELAGRASSADENA
jgi:ferritin